MKQRVTALDVRALVNDIRPAILDQRLQNIYDVSNKIFLFKFGQGDEKTLLLVESGLRIHTTVYSREKAKVPSNFCTKLRKHLRNRRITGIDQVGTDRVVRMSFISDHPAVPTYHLYMEFFAGGNVILTDQDSRILSLLRVVILSAPVKKGKKVEHDDKADTRDMRVGELYHGESTPSPSPEDASSSPETTTPTSAHLPPFTTAWPADAADLQHQVAAFFEEGGPSSGGMGVGKALGLLTGLGSGIGESILISATATSLHLKDSAKSLDTFLSNASEEDWHHLYTSMHALASTVLIPESGLGGPGNSGYLLYSTLSTPEVEAYESFSPLLPLQHAHSPDAAPAGSSTARTKDPLARGFAPGPRIQELPSMDRALDQYFSKAEGQKQGTKVEEKGKTAERKLASVKRDQYGRIAGLAKAKEECEVKAIAIQSSLHAVDTAIARVTRTLDEEGLSWPLIQRSFQSKWEPEEDDPVEDDEGETGDMMDDDDDHDDAHSIATTSAITDATDSTILSTLKDTGGAPDAWDAQYVGFKLEKRQFSLSLRDPYYEEGADAPAASNQTEGLEMNLTGKKAKKKAGAPPKPKTSAVPKGRILVDIRLGMTAFGNAREYHTHRKNISAKEARTQEMAARAFKNAEKKIAKDVREGEKGREKGREGGGVTGIIEARRAMWFEKFLWTITSEGFLCLGGRDAQQNEVLVKRHLGAQDIYVHADLHGAATVIVKASPRHGGGWIPPTPAALVEGGIMSVCQSKAWSAKIPGSAYWVRADQVSKTAPTGEYLGTGSFMIRGKRTFLPPVPLVYGYGILWKVKEKVVVEEEGEEEEEEEEEDIDEDHPADQEMKEGGKKTKEDTPSHKDDWWVLSKGQDNTSQEEGEGEGSPLADDAQSIRSMAQEEKYHHEEEDTPAPKEGDTGAFIDQLIREQEERRLLRAQKEDASPKDGSSSAKDPSIGRSGKPKQSAPPPPPPVPVSTRGKKTKAKRAKDKYADQDEEDLEAWKARVAPDRGPQPKGKKEKRKAEVKALHALAIQQREEALRAYAEAKAANPVDDGSATGDAAPSEVSSSSEAKTEVEADPTAEPAPVDETEGEASSPDTHFLSSLTPLPLPGDHLLVAIPICAPWPTLEKYKYKVKLQPGTLKKGKACKSAQVTILSMIGKGTPEADIERDLVRGIPEMEQISVMLSNTKVIGSEDSEKKGGGNRGRGRK